MPSGIYNYERANKLQERKTLAKSAEHTNALGFKEQKSDDRFTY